MVANLRKWSLHISVFMMFIGSILSEIRCPEPGVPEHGVRNEDSFAAGPKVVFSCFNDYDVLGSPERECLPDGKWSGQLAPCNIESNYCPNPETPVNGMKSRTNYGLGDSVYFACRPGYILIGSEVRECMPDRTWSGAETKCLRIYNYDAFENRRNTLKGILAKKAAEKKQDLQESRLLTMNEECKYFYTNSDRGRLFLHFAFDDSENTGEQNFNKSVELAKAIVTKVGISSTGTLANAFLFGSTNDIMFTTEYPDTTERVLKRLGRMKYKGGRSSTESALELLNEMIEQTQVVYGEDSLKSVVFIFSNGQGTNYSFPKIEASKLKSENNIEIFCIGVTEDVSLTPLEDIASDPKEKHIFTIENYPLMALLVADITKTIGPYVSNVNPRGRITLNTNLKNSPKKGNRLLLYFAFDDSRNTGEHHFKKSIEFAKAMVKKVVISREGNLAGALTFGSKSTLQVIPVIPDSTKDVIEVLDTLNYTGEALSSSPFDDVDMMIDVTKYIYSTYRLTPVVFILSNGFTDLDLETKIKVNQLKNKFMAEIYCIGITDDASQESLYYIASEPKNEHIYILENYPTMSWLIQNITEGKTDYSQCGLGHDYIHTVRIVGGRKVTDPWPWMATLYFVTDKSNNEVQLLCGGSIVHDSYILTAAHCLYDENSRLREPRDIIVKLGLIDLKNETFLQVPEVIQVIPHADYRNRPAYFDYDIALLRLKQPILFNSRVRPICLPPLDLAPDNTLYDPTKLGMAIGWGHEENVFPNTHQEVNITEHLKEIILPIQSREKCTRSLTNYGQFRMVFTDNMFCAGDGLIGNYTNYGDSGSPFMQWQRNPHGDLYWIQIGIVSWGIGCRIPDTYGFYTHVQRQRSWIDETMQSTPNDLN